MGKTKAKDFDQLVGGWKIRCTCCLNRCSAVRCRDMFCFHRGHCAGKGVAV